MFPHMIQTYCDKCGKNVSHEAKMGAFIRDPETQKLVFGRPEECPICKTILNEKEIVRFKELREQGHEGGAIL